MPEEPLPPDGRRHRLRRARISAISIPCEQRLQPRRHLPTGGALGRRSRHHAQYGYFSDF